jgi:hypothetical protein
MALNSILSLNGALTVCINDLIWSRDIRVAILCLSEPASLEMQWCQQMQAGAGRENPPGG